MTPYHCHNRPPFKDFLIVKTYLPAAPLFGRAPAMVIGEKQIPNTMSKDCRHELRATDPRCAGCKWIKTPQL
jgi:hypothetical protein